MLEQFHSLIAENELNVLVLGLMKLLVSSDVAGQFRVIWFSLNSLLIKVWLLSLFSGMETIVKKTLHMCTHTHTHKGCFNSYSLPLV